MFTITFQKQVPISMAAVNVNVSVNLINDDFFCFNYLI